MISKERLEELIKQGATIYDIFKGDIYLVDLTMAKYYDVPKYIEYKNDYYNCNLTRSIDDLFETKEEAEEYLEFGNITRTERLDLPTWEEFNKKGCFYFVGKNYSFYQIYKRYNKIHLEWSDDETYYMTIQEWKLTKENYLEARRLCKKLFLGEE